MQTDPKTIDRAIALLIFLFAGLVFSLILWYVRQRGMLPLDDAYITFRYAENLARGKGFVYNEGERILGTTTPLFCLLLAWLRWLGIKPTLSADLFNLLSAMVSSVLIFLLGRSYKDRSLGLTASLLFIFFPPFWLSLASGMETMFTIFLALTLVWLDLRAKPILGGIIAGLLVLTRVDALALLASVLILRFFKKPGQSLKEFLVCLFTLLPWVIFALIYFGSPLPHSLIAKKLIHPYPSGVVFWRYFSWFLGIRDLGQGDQWALKPLVVYSFFALLTSVRSFFKDRGFLVFVFWIVFFIGGMMLGRVTPFFWYRIPMLSGYIVLSAFGIQWFCNFLWSSKRWALVLNYLLVMGLSTWFVYISEPRSFEVMTFKERANFRAGEKVKRFAKPGDKILVGELGIAGYELLDYYIIDSSGLVSERVYQARKRDRENLMKISSAYQWDWWGSPAWVKEVIKEYDPDFILSETGYLHLRTLVNEREFEASWVPIAVEKMPRHIVLVFQRRREVR